MYISSKDIAVILFMFDCTLSVAMDTVSLIVKCRFDTLAVSASPFFSVIFLHVLLTLRIGHLTVHMMCF